VRPFDGRRVLQVVSGGIAAYKSASVVRRLLQAGAEVEVVLTEAAGRFVGPVTFEGLTDRPVHTDLWDRPMAHLELGKRADVVLVAPATADLLARMAAGRADDLAATTLLACDAPVVACPAMNARMWRHPATARNVARIREDGVHLVGPEHGELAEGEVGPGRMAEPGVVVDEVGRVLEGETPWRDRVVVVTAGSTRAPLDPVRFLTSGSSGRMGYALAASAWRRGAETVLVSGPGRVPPPYGPRVVEVRESEEMLEELRTELQRADLLLMAAAVTDFRPEEVREAKIKKDEGPLHLTLERGPDLLQETRRLREERGVRTLGFALETEPGADAAREKLESKGLDWVALNQAGRSGVGMEATENEVTLLDRWGGSLEIPRLAKTDVAERILDRMEVRLAEPGG